MVTVFPPSETALWWVFSFAAERPNSRVADSAFVVGDRVVPVDKAIVLPVTAPGLLPREPPLLVTAGLEDGMVKACGIASSGHFEGELEYAFCLPGGGER
jgi:hypothetical protein